MTGAWSIRTRLVVALVSAVLLLAGVAAVVLVLVVRQRAVDDFDADLKARVRAMAPMVRRDEFGRLEVRFDEGMMWEFAARRHRPEYFEVRGPDGNVLATSPSLGGRELEAAPGGDARRVTLPDGRSGRAVSLTYVPQLADKDDELPEVMAMRSQVTLTLARGTRVIDEMLEVLWWGLGAAAAVMAGGTGVVVWVVVSRGLGPVRELAERTREIDASHLAARYPTDVPRELAPIVVRLNELLARLEGAFARERRFSAAAAHELRTPIAEIRAIAEVALRWPGESRQGMGEVLEVARDMERLATTLLALSRCESGQEAVRREAVDLRRVVEGVWEGVKGRAGERGVTLEVRAGEGSRKVDGERRTSNAERPTPKEGTAGQAGRGTLVSSIGDRMSEGEVVGDPEMVEAVVRNLVENAVEYSTAGGRVVCEVGGGRLVVSNAQTGLSREDVGRMFEPFWRKEKGRSREYGHAGLGLALVKAYAAAMGGGVEGEVVDGEFRVDVRFGERVPMEG